MSRRGRFLLVLLAALGLAPCAAEPDAGLAEGREPVPGVIGPPPGRYGDTQVLLPASLAAGTVARYRFSPKDDWKPFDRPLYLSAFRGEHRRYELEFLSPGAGQPVGIAYEIDRLAPEAPSFSVPSGDSGASLTLALAGEGRPFLSVDGSPFAEYDPARPPRFVAPPDGTRVVAADAYAVDEAGNASRSVAGVWRLFPSGFTPSFSAPAAPAAPVVRRVETGQAASAKGLRASIEDARGSALLRVEAPAGAVPVAAVNAPVDPSSQLPSASAFAQLSAESSGLAVIPFPWGYDQPIAVHYGYRLGDDYIVAPEPLRLVPSFAEAASSAPPARPLEPVVRSDGERALLDWPESPWPVVVSVDGGAYERYRSPVLVELGGEAKAVAYYALGLDGSRSAEAVVTLPPRRRPSRPAVTGIAQGGRYGSGAQAFPAPGQRLRYELSEGGAEPPALSASSPVMDASGLRLPGRQGAVVGYSLRIAVDEVPFGPAAERVVAERVVACVVDREPPPTPRLRESLGSYSSDDARLSFEPSAGVVYVSVSEDGNGPFARYDGPVTIAGSDEGRRRYVVRAYAEDEFGNRSPEAEPVRITIDRSSLYVDGSGRPGASGSPDDPMPRLDDAIDAALAAGKRFVCVRGSVVLGRPVSIASRLSVVGGHDEEWNQRPGRRSSVRASVPSGFALSVIGAELELRDLDLALSGDGAKGAVSAMGGSVLVSGCRLAMGGGIEKTALSLSGADLSLEGSGLELGDAVTARGIDLTGGRLLVSDSSIRCEPQAKMFEGIRLTDAEAELSGLRIEAAPALAASALGCTGSRVAIERSILSLAASASSCRAFGASASTLTARSLYLDVAGKGSAELFSLSNGSRLDAYHITAFMGAPKAAFLVSAASAASLRNSIVNAAGDRAVLVRSDTPLAAGSIDANCLWGLAAMVEGRPYPSAILDVGGLNALTSPSAANIAESPAVTFRAVEKGLRRLSRASACVNSGIVAIGGAAATRGADLFGLSREGRADAPDRGAEELP